MARFKVYVSDYDYPNLAIETAVLEPIGAEVVGLQCRTGEGLAELAADADAILQQYARIPRETIARLKRCKAICRYGIGVDIVDVKAAHEHGIVVTKRAGLLPGRSGRSHDRARLHADPPHSPLRRGRARGSLALERAGGPCTGSGISSGG